MKRISDRVEYSFWEKYDETHSVIRLATSWATAKENVESLAGVLVQLSLS